MLSLLLLLRHPYRECCEICVWIVDDFILFATFTLAVRLTASSYELSPLVFFLPLFSVSTVPSLPDHSWLNNSNSMKWQCIHIHFAFKLKLIYFCTMRVPYVCAGRVWWSSLCLLSPRRNWTRSNVDHIVPWSICSLCVLVLYGHASVQVYTPYVSIITPVLFNWPGWFWSGDWFPSEIIALSSIRDFMLPVYQPTHARLLKNNLQHAVLFPF